MGIVAPGEEEKKILPLNSNYSFFHGNFQLKLLDTSTFAITTIHISQTILLADSHLLECYAVSTGKR